MRFALAWVAIWVLAAASATGGPINDDLIEQLRDDGYNAYLEGDYPAAAGHYRQALNLCENEDHPDPALSAWLASDLAEMERLGGDYLTAEELLRGAVNHSRSVHPPDPYLPTYLSNLAALLWDLERLDETERILREVRRLVGTDESASPHLRATLDLNLGVVLRDQGRLDEARPLLVAARDSARTAVTDSSMLPYFLSEPAKLFAMQGDWTFAHDLWEEALALVPPVDRPGSAYRAQILMDMAAARARQGDLTTALAELDEVVALRRYAFGEHHPEVGAALAARARWNQLQDGAHSKAALAAADSALAILADSPAAVVERATAHAVRARAVHAAGEVKSGLANMTAALELIEMLRPRRGATDMSRIRFLQDFQKDYEELVTWLVAADSTAAALLVADKLRARILAERLGLDTRRLHAGMDPEVLDPLLTREHAARARLVHLERALSAARTGGGMAVPAATTQQDRLRTELDLAWLDFQAVQAEIRLHSPAWRRLEKDGATVSVDAAARTLAEPGRVILIYHLAAAGSYVFVLGGPVDALQVHRLRLPDDEAAPLGLPANLDPDLLAHLMTGITDTIDGSSSRGVGGMTFVDSRKAAGALDITTRLNLLWRYLTPGLVREQVLSASEVVVIPSGDLALLPFDALIVGPGPRFWLDDGPPVRTAPSFSLLMRQAAGPLAESVPEAETILSVCNPDFAGRLDPADSPWPRLPGTCRETQALSQAFAGASVTVLSNGLATESAVREHTTGATLIHLATHGYSPLDSPWRSGLVLATDHSLNHDGVLQRHEIAELNLEHCDLAILSACQTAAARPVAGEGVFALAQAFRIAGVRQTVSALWAVDDEAGAVLMSHFFQSLAQARIDGRSVPVSRLLQEAKRAVRAEPRWESPFYWAAFVCDGED